MAKKRKSTDAEKAQTGGRMNPTPEQLHDDGRCASDCSICEREGISRDVDVTEDPKLDEYLAAERRVRAKQMEVAQQVLRKIAAQ